MKKNITVNLQKIKSHKTKYQDLINKLTNPNDFDNFDIAMREYIIDSLEKLIAEVKHYKHSPELYIRDIPTLLTNHEINLINCYSAKFDHPQYEEQYNKID